MFAWVQMALLVGISSLSCYIVVQAAKDENKSHSMIEK